MSRALVVLVLVLLDVAVAGLTILIYVHSGAATTLLVIALVSAIHYYDKTGRESAGRKGAIQ